MSPRISIVVPTHNRRDAVVRLLTALEGQHSIDGGFDVAVVCDGCTDDTAIELKARRFGFPLVVIEQTALGPAEARNNGARSAHGDILLFLDDDVEPTPEVLRVHDAFHARVDNGVGVGDLPPSISAAGFFGIIVRGWLASMFDGAREQGHRYTYRDVLTGHCSIRRIFFESLGGFDSSLRCHEDYELGYRAIEAGAEVRFLPDAIARHCDNTDLGKLLRRKFDEGVADVCLARKHPAMRAQLPLAAVRRRGRVAVLFEWLAWNHPPTGDALAAALEAEMRAYERLRLRFRWRARLEQLMDYWYWRGAAKEAGRHDALAALMPDWSAPFAPDVVVDLALGIAQAERQLDQSGPRSMRLTYGSEVVADLKGCGGAERLRGRHLRRIIARECTREFLRAASRAGRIPRPLPPPALFEPSSRARLRRAAEAPAP